MFLGQLISSEISVDNQVQLQPTIHMLIFIIPLSKLAIEFVLSNALILVQEYLQLLIAII